MKYNKFAIIVLLNVISVNLDAQISVNKRVVISDLNLGHQRLEYLVNENKDTTFFCNISSNNEYHGRIIVVLGPKNQAIITLQSMIDYNESDGNIISLNNPSENNAIFGRVLGVKMFTIFEKSSNKIYGYLHKKQIVKFLEELK